MFLKTLLPKQVDIVSFHLGIILLSVLSFTQKNMEQKTLNKMFSVKLFTMAKRTTHAQMSTAQMGNFNVQVQLMATEIWYTGERVVC